jgi:ATP phosphoribosyltransferase
MKERRFAVPSGSLQERTLEILQQAGYQFAWRVGRDDFFGSANGVQFYLRDRGNIAQLVRDGIFDAGITGSDLVINSGVLASELTVVMDLPYSRATNGATRWVLAGPAGLQLGKVRIGTERMKLAEYCLADFLSQGAELVQLPGKEESAVGDGLCDAVFVVTETGSSLAAHGLTILRDNLFVSNPQLLASPRLSSAELSLMEEIGLAMRSILDAEKMATITFDLRRDKLEGLKLPAAVSPTINNTLDPDWIAGQVLIERQQLGCVLRQLRLVGAQGVFMQDVQGYMKGGEIES